MIRWRLIGPLQAAVHRLLIIVPAQSGVLHQTGADLKYRDYVTIASF